MGKNTKVKQLHLQQLIFRLVNGGLRSCMSNLLHSSAGKEHQIFGKLKMTTSFLILGDVYNLQQHSLIRSTQHIQEKIVTHEDLHVHIWKQKKGKKHLFM